MRDDEPVRILLVEDNTADVYLFRKALLGAELNFELTVIEDGGRAIAFVRGEGEYAGSPVPDLVVLDLSLPKNDGIQVLEAIRATKRFANVPVVITSSSPSPPARLKDGAFASSPLHYEAARSGGLFADRQGIEGNSAPAAKPVTLGDEDEQHGEPHYGNERRAEADSHPGGRRQCG